MFRETADLYDAIYSFKDYAAEAARISALVRERNPGARTLLDVACGTGKHLEMWMREFECAGIDLDAKMLDIARARCPGVDLITADMAGFDLGRRFDVVVSMFSSIGYMRTPERLNAAAKTLVEHLAPGGVLLVEPWLLPEVFTGDRVFMDVVDEPELKVARMGRPERDGSLSRVRFDYLIATPSGAQHVEEVHELGLFSDAQYRAAFAAAGVPVERLEDDGAHGRGLYVGVAPV